MKKTFAHSALALLVMGAASTAMARAPSPADAQYTADSKAAMARYNDDKKLCNDETSSAGRLQCRRDAKADYYQAIAAAKARQKSANAAMAAAAPAVAGKPAPAAAPVCADCGRVTAVHIVEKAGEAGALGTVGGGVAGAVVGHQVGGGTGKDIATVAGAVGGALLGRELEKRYKSRKVWNVDVQYDNGDKKTFSFDNDPHFGVGDWVKNSGNSITRN